MLCDSAETALRIDSQWSRRQIRQRVRAALLFGILSGDFQYKNCLAVVALFLDRLPVIGVFLSCLNQTFLQYSLVYFQKKLVFSRQVLLII